MLWHLSKLRWVRFSWVGHPNAFLVFSRTAVYSAYAPNHALGGTLS